MPKAELQKKLKELFERVNSGLWVWQGDVENIGSIGFHGVTGSGTVVVELDPVGGRCWVSGLIVV